MKKLIAITLISFLALPAFAGKNDDVLKERKKTRAYRACEAYGRAGGSIYFTADGKCHIDTEAAASKVGAYGSVSRGYKFDPVNNPIDALTQKNCEQVRLNGGSVYYNNEGQCFIKSPPESPIFVHILSY